MAQGVDLVLSPLVFAHLPYCKADDKPDASEAAGDGDDPRVGCGGHAHGGG